MAGSSPAMTIASSLAENALDQPAIRAREEAVRLATARLPGSATLSAMLPSRSIDQVETDLLALRAAAERAGTALACLFSSSDEFEAAVIKARRDAGAFGPRRKRRATRYAVLTAILAAAFLML